MGHGGSQPPRSARAWSRRALAPVIGVCLAVLSACGGGPATVAPATSTPLAVATRVSATTSVPAPATPIPRPPGLGDIRWTSEAGSAATPAAAVTQLRSDVPRIAADLPAYEIPAGSQVSATWSYNNTSLDAFATTITIDHLQDEQWLTFQLSRNTDAPWPTGVYEITISLDGQVAQTSSVEVVP